MAAVWDGPATSAITLNVVFSEERSTLEAARQEVEALERGASGELLRRRLVLVDVAMAAIAWIATVGSPLRPEPLDIRWWAVAAALAGITVLLVLASGLHRARVASVRSTEVVRLAYISVAVGLIGAGFASALHLEADSVPLVGAALGFLLLAGGRSMFRNWLLAQRATGKRLRAVVIVGADDEAQRMADHLAEYPQIGYKVVGFLRSVEDDSVEVGPVLGEADQAASVLQAIGVRGAIVVPGALNSDECDKVISDLLAHRIHVHLAPGIRGVDSRRLRSSPMGHEPLLYLEPSGGSAPHYAPLRRVIDVVGATIGLVLTAPVVALVAIAIKLTDGGPVLFRQERAGMNGRPFMLLKLRSMTVDAEERLDEIKELNEREGGPLFKLDDDPRVTRIGALIRATSIDEIPQLINVLRGEMSLVGPRPAIISETQEFDDELMIRQEVRPGVTGLWQVEARDNPSFNAYRYLDVFYVENQSLSLDLTILMATFRAVARSCARAFKARMPRRTQATQAAPAAEAGPRTV